MTDNELLHQLKDPVRQRNAFRYLVEQYSETLYWRIRHFVIDHDDADDVLQNTFIKAWTNLESFEGKSKLLTWLMRIAINESLDFLRRQKNVQKVSTDDDTGIANRLMADNYFDGDETEAMLQEAIAQLPDVQRMVFNLRYFDEMKYQDMAKLLDRSEGALKASYHHAVQKITEYFQRRD